MSRSPGTLRDPLVGTARLPVPTVVAWKDAVVDAAEDVGANEVPVAVYGPAGRASPVLADTVPPEGAPVMQLALAVSQRTADELVVPSVGVVTASRVLLSRSAAVSCHRAAVAEYPLATTVVGAQLLAHPEVGADRTDVAPYEVP